MPQANRGRSEAGEVVLGESGDLGLFVGSVDAATGVEEVGLVRVDVVGELASCETAGPEAVNEDEERGAGVEGEVGLTDEVETEQGAPRERDSSCAVSQAVQEMFSSPVLGEGRRPGLGREARAPMTGAGAFRCASVELPEALQVTSGKRSLCRRQFERRWDQRARQVRER
jgi:hypothetical protein